MCICRYIYIYISISPSPYPPSFLHPPAGKALQLLIAHKIPCFDMESGLTTADYGWGTKSVPSAEHRVPRPEGPARGDCTQSLGA